VFFEKGSYAKEILLKTLFYYCEEKITGARCCVQVRLDEEVSSIKRQAGIYLS